MGEFLVSDSLISALKLAGFISIAYVLVLWLSAVVWTYRDVRKRTNDALSQSVATLLVGLFNLPGLIIYLVIRPHETIADSYERSLEAEAMLHELEIDASTCQNCRRPIEADYNVCPQCRILLREPCIHCNRLVRTNWAACAYCGMERSQPRVTPLSREATAPPPLQRPSRQAPAAISQGPAAER